MGPVPKADEAPARAVERRTQREGDRRENARGGKFDRRRNRCRHCRHFAWDGAAAEGHCQRHELAFAPDAFACVLFEPSEP